MTTYPTIDAARAAAGQERRWILEVELEGGERAYVVSLVPLDALRRRVAASGKSVSGVRRLVAEHPARTPEREAAERREALRTHTRCERCGVAVDGNTAYSQPEWTRVGGQRVRVVAHYCEGCRTLLGAIGAGERTAMQERAAHQPSTDPDTYEE